MLKLSRLMTLALGCGLLSSCGMGGGCSAVKLDILVDSGIFANTISARITNGSSDMRQVTILATDPEGNSSQVGPISIAANDSVTRALGPLMKSYGSTQSELESNGAKFEISACE